MGTRIEKSYEINRRQFLTSVGAGAVAAAMSPLLSQLPAAQAADNIAEAGDQQRRPNFVIIFCDDLGYGDIGCFGAKAIKTPNIDKMADEGMKFTKFYVASPVCSPSRAALLTGCYPKRVGINIVLHPTHDFGLNPTEITLAKLLKQQDYATACVGKWHLGHHAEFLPTRHGFDSYFGIPYSNDMKPTVLMRDEKVIENDTDQDRLTERYTQESVDFITRNKDRPFFLYLAHTMPHIPLHVSEKFKGRSAGGLYGDVVECIDWSAGQIVQTLRDLGLEKNTYVIFTSDNGPWLQKGKDAGTAGPLRGGKFGTCEGGVREPFVLWAPGHVPEGKTCTELAASIDLYPTLAKLAGARLPDNRVIDGKDISALWAGKQGAKSPHEEFFYYSSTGRLEAIQSGPWKLRITTPKAAKSVPAGGTAAATASSPAAVQIELFDLEKDIGESTNLAQKDPDTVAKLKLRMEQFDAELEKNIRPAGKVASASTPTTKN